MEHRWYTRQELVGAVLLCQNGKPLCHSQVADISRDGLAVRNPSALLFCGDCVELVFSDSLRCLAVVVHVSVEKLGLMCADVNPFYNLTRPRLLTAYSTN